MTFISVVIAVETRPPEKLVMTKYLFQNDDTTMNFKHHGWYVSSHASLILYVPLHKMKDSFLPTQINYTLSAYTE